MNALSRRTILKSAFSTVGTCGIGSLLSAQDWRGTSRRGSRGLITQDVQTTIDNGLQYLVQRQTMIGNQRGSFGNDGYRANTAVVGSLDETPLLLRHFVKKK